VVPVILTGVDYRRAHEACHNAALIWNELVAAQRTHWESAKADLSRDDLYALTSGLDPALLELHSQTLQALAHDLPSAISTSRENRKAGLKGRAPHLIKAYRPLTFTRNFGWRVNPQGRLALSLGRGRARVILPLPVLIDPATGLVVPASQWGGMRLCWDRDGRRWALHIAVPTVPAPALDQSQIMGVDEGIINPMTLAVATSRGLRSR
jgi:putative transposase